MVGKFNEQKIQNFKFVSLKSDFPIYGKFICERIPLGSPPTHLTDKKETRW